VDNKPVHVHSQSASGRPLDTSSQAGSSGRPHGGNSTGSPVLGSTDSVNEYHNRSHEEQQHGENSVYTRQI